MKKGFRVLITDKCNMKCPSCFNRGLRTNKEMSLYDFEELCDYLKSEGQVSRLKIMGGEPTTHPDFLKIVSIAQQNFDSVHVFTNGVNDEITKVEMREHDTIIYNLSCMGEKYPSSKLMPEKNFIHAYETRIDAQSSVERIKRVLAHIHSIVGDKIVVNLTLNCVEEIFDHKEKIISNWNAVVSYLEDEMGMGYRVDHAIPYCFFVGSNMRLKISGSLCSLNCTGLISPDLQLRHCNQTSENLLHIRKNGKFVPWKILEQYIYCEHAKMAHTSLSKVCRDCMFYGEKCDGGCFVFKSSITRESILSATDLPVT